MTEFLTAPTPLNRQKVNSLPDGYGLSTVRKTGVYYVNEPTNGPIGVGGDFFLTVLEGERAYGNMAVQQLIKLSNGVQYIRVKQQSGWSTWTTQTGEGGGGASDASLVEYENVGNFFDITGSTTLSDILAKLGASYARIPLNPSRTFNVLDYGANPSGNMAHGAINRAAFENAILAANAVGGGVIYAPRGTYYINYGGAASVGGVRLRSNMTLQGDGIGVTIIKCADIGNNDLAGLVRTQSGIENSNVIVRDLTIDGNKSEQTGWANIICFFAGVTPNNRVNTDKNIWCINVECKNGKNGTTGSSNLNRGYGFDPHEVVERFIAINCIAHDNERDGFVLDGVIDFQLTNCQSWNNGRYGYNFITETFNGQVTSCQAWNNGAVTGGNFTVQGNSHHITFTNCISRESGEQGMRIRRGNAVTSTFIKVIGCTFEQNGRNGIQITGCDHNTIENNYFIDNSQEANATYFDVSLDDDDGDIEGDDRGAQHNIIRGNYAVVTGDFANAPKGAYRENKAAASPPSNNVFMWNESHGAYTNTKYQNVYSTIRDRGFLDYYNAKDHGALGDGTTDDGPALRSLVSLVEARGGGLIVLPPGTYRVSGTGTASQGCLSLPSGVSIEGAGAGVTTILVSDSVNNNITGAIRTRSGQAVTGVDLSGFSLTMEESSGTADVTGIYIDNASLVTLQGIVVTNAQNGTDNAGFGIRTTSAASKITISDVQVVDAERDGIYVDASTNVTLRNCVVTGSARHNINISNAATYAVVDGCLLSSAGVNNLFLSESAANAKIVNNTLHTSGEDGIRVRRGSAASNLYLTIQNNTIHTSGRDGISVAGAGRIVIAGNFFFNNGANTNTTYHDVSLELDSTYNTTKCENVEVTNNVMYALAANKTQYAISEGSAAATNNRFNNNWSEGQAAARYRIDGASTSKWVDVENPVAVGSVGAFQYANSTGHAAAATGLTYDTVTNRPRVPNGIEVGAVASPTVPAAGNIVLTSTNILAGLAAITDISGWKRFIGSDRTKLSWGEAAQSPNTAPTTVTSAPTHIGLALTNMSAGTVTAQNVTTGGPANQGKRFLFTGPTASTNNKAGYRSSSRFLWRGNAANLGGFYWHCRFGKPTYGAATVPRCFVGLIASSNDAVDNTSFAATSNWVDCIGVGFETNSGDMSIYRNDASGAPTLTALTGFDIATAGWIVDFSLFCKPNDSSIYWLAEYTAGTTQLQQTGVFTTDIPANNTFLSQQVGVGSTSDSEQVSILFHKMAYELFSQ